VVHLRRLLIIGCVAWTAYYVYQSIRISPLFQLHAGQVGRVPNRIPYKYRPPMVAPPIQRGFARAPRSTGYSGGRSYGSPFGGRSSIKQMHDSGFHRNIANNTYINTTVTARSMSQSAVSSALLRGTGYGRGGGF